MNDIGDSLAATIALALISKTELADKGSVDIDAIRKRYDHYGETKSLNKGTAVHDIRLLLEEIERLRATGCDGDCACGGEEPSALQLAERED